MAYRGTDEIMRAKLCSDEHTGSIANARFGSALLLVSLYTWAEASLDILQGEGCHLLLEAGVIAQSCSRGRKSSSVSGNWLCHVLALW